MSSMSFDSVVAEIRPAMRRPEEGSLSNSTDALHAKMRETAQQIAECFAFLQNARNSLQPGEKLALGRAVCDALERCTTLRAALGGGVSARTKKDAQVDGYSGLDSDIELARELLDVPAGHVPFDQVFATLQRAFARAFKSAQV